MSAIEAVVLGIVQGLTEFLPISSSGHLVLVPAILGWESPSVTYDVMLHVASLVAVLIYFRREVFEVLEGIGRPGPQRRFAGLLVVGTIPAAIVGVTLESPITRMFDQPRLVASLLIFTAAILFVGETVARRKRTADEPEESSLSVVEKISVEAGWGQALVVGMAQALAILPGVSRSGSTIGAGLITGLSRPQAARFSFMLFIPILIGTAVAELPNLGNEREGLQAIFIGGVACFIASYVAIAGMIGYLQRRGLYPFAAYCLVVGGLANLVLRV